MVFMIANAFSIALKIARNNNRYYTCFNRVTKISSVRKSFRSINIHMEKVKEHFKAQFHVLKIPITRSLLTARI